MPADRLVRRSELAADIRRIGVRPGAVLFVHTSMRSLGWVVGGAETVVNALLDAVGPAGTVAAVASWSDIPLRMDEWDPARRRAYLDEMPGFHPEHSEANPRYGRIPERLRSWPGSRKSAHPDQRVIAVGARAHWLTGEHPLDDSFGPGTPFARLVEADGQVLMLGAPLRSLTLLHHAEALVRLPGKRRRRYALPFAAGGGREWRTLDDIDVEYGPFAYAEVVPDCDPLDGIAAMASAAVAAGIGRRRRIANAESHLFPAAALVRFATAWLTERFSAPPQQRDPEHPGRREAEAQRRE
jgi:aminoglycoside 3-N-acetyltransferase